MPLPIGQLGHFGYGKETTYGTAVAPARFVPLASESLEVDKGIITNIGILGNRHIDHQGYEGPLSIAGDISFYVMKLNELPHFLIAALGASITTILEAGAVGQHVFLSGKNAANPSLTVEIDRETRADRYSGVKINTLAFEISGEQDTPIKLTAGIVAQDVASATAATASFGTDTPMLFHNAATVTIGGTDVSSRLLAATINLDNGLAPRRTIKGQKKPAAIDEGAVKVTGSLSLYFDSASEYADYLAATQRALILEFQGALIAGVTKYTLKFNVPKAVFTAAPVNIEPEGQTLVAAEFTGLYDSTTGGALEVTVRNTESTAP